MRRPSQCAGRGSRRARKRIEECRDMPRVFRGKGRARHCSLRRVARRIDDETSDHGGPIGKSACDVSAVHQATQRRSDFSSDGSHARDGVAYRAAILANEHSAARSIPARHSHRDGALLRPVAGRDRQEHATRRDPWMKPPALHRPALIARRVDGRTGLRRAFRHRVAALPRNKPHCPGYPRDSSGWQCRP